MLRFCELKSMVIKTAFLGLFLLLNTLLFAQPEIEEKLALQFYQNQDYDKAAELYQRIYARTPTPFYYNYYLDCLFELEDYKRAKGFVRAVSKKYPNQYRYQVDEAYVVQRSGNKEKANKAYGKIIKGLGNNRNEVIELADAFLIRDLDNYALKTYIKAKKKIKNPPLNMEIADLYYKMGDYNSMINEYLDLAVMDETYIPTVQSKLQGIITDPSQDKISEELRIELLRRTQKHPSETLYSELLYWYSIQKKDFELALMQSKALDRQFGDRGGRVFALGNILMSNQEYSLAVEAYQYVIDLGEDSEFLYAAGVNILEARFKKIISEKNYSQEELVSLEKSYLDALNTFGKNGTTVQMMMNLAYLQAFYLDNIESAKALLLPIEQMNNVPNDTRAKAKLQLADMKLFSGEKWSASLLYKQVEKAHKNEPIGYEAKFKAAKFFYYVGEMEWAKVQLKVLSGATSKLIANDALDLYLLITENISMDSTYDALSIYATADLLHYQKKYDLSIITLDTILDIFPHHPITDDVYFKKAMIAMDQQEFQLADSLFAETLDYDPFGTLADNALIERARLNDYILKKPDIAKELYQKILLDYPGSLFTVEARKQYREMEKR